MRSFARRRQPVESQRRAHHERIFRSITTAHAFYLLSISFADSVHLALSQIVISTKPTSNKREADHSIRMSAITPHLTYIIKVILNSAVFAVGMMVSVITPVIFHMRLSTLYSRNGQSPPKDLNAAKSEGRSSDSTTSFWGQILIPLIFLTALAYMILVYNFWLELDSVLLAVFKATVTIIGMFVGFFIPALIVVCCVRGNQTE